LNQINFAFGLVGLHKHKHFYMNVVESLSHLDQTGWESLLVFAISTPLLWFMMRKIPAIPWTVVLPIISIPIGALSNHDLLGSFQLLTLKSKYGMLDPTLVMPLTPLTDLVPAAETGGFIVAAISTAVVAVLETLISAKIAATRVDRNFDELIEMRGLTLSHLVCGVTGAMPPTGVFVRTSLNTNLGATHRFSQFLNGVAVLIIFMIVMPAFSYVPQATIAAILVVASIRMTPFTYLKKLWKEDKGALALLAVTCIICVMEDPVIGLAVGMVIALLHGAMKQKKSDLVRIGFETAESGRSYTVKILGSLTYLSSDSFVDTARRLEQPSEVHLDVGCLLALDHDGASAVNKVVSTWLEQVSADNLFVHGVSKPVAAKLGFFSWFQDAQVAGRAEVLESAKRGDLPPERHALKNAEMSEVQLKMPTLLSEPATAEKGADKV